MATTFTKIGNKVLIKKPSEEHPGNFEYTLKDASAEVRTEDRMPGKLIITSASMDNADQGTIIDIADITGITFTTTEELLEILATDFFFRVTTVVEFSNYRFIEVAGVLNVDKKVDGEWVTINAFE